MARATKETENATLNPRKVQFNVKATPVVRRARADFLRAIVEAKGREADLDGLRDTLEVLYDFLKERGERDKKQRHIRMSSAVKTAKAAQKVLDNQRVETAKHDVQQAAKGLSAAKEKLKAVQGRQKANS